MTRNARRIQKNHRRWRNLQFNLKEGFSSVEYAREICQDMAGIRDKSYKAPEYALVF
jgi:hypothetical protein